uniref:Uncharacterized protein n=1 Tax=Meloidogyne incognita TaxID=6306 RepID=A0A914KMX4_MELIC
MFLSDRNVKCEERTVRNERSIPTIPFSITNIFHLHTFIASASTFISATGNWLSSWIVVCLEFLRSNLIII